MASTTTDTAGLIKEMGDTIAASISKLQVGTVEMAADVKTVGGTVNEDALAAFLYCSRCLNQDMPLLDPDAPAKSARLRAEGRFDDATRGYGQLPGVPHSLSFDAAAVRKRIDAGDTFPACANCGHPK